MFWVHFFIYKKREGSKIKIPIKIDIRYSLLKKGKGKTLDFIHQKTQSRALIWV